MPDLTSLLDQLDHPSFDYGWSPQKGESALSPEATAHSAWCSSPSSSPSLVKWQDEFRVESARVARFYTPQGSAWDVTRGQLTAPRAAPGGVPRGPGG